MLYAIFESGGKQYKVKENDQILVDRLDLDTAKTLNFSNVLMVRTDDGVVLGTPYIENCQIEGKIVSHLKGEKLRISKFKAKVRYRKTIGFRPYLTRILIEKIIFAQSKSAKKHAKE